MRDSQLAIGSLMGMSPLEMAPVSVSALDLPDDLSQSVQIAVLEWALQMVADPSSGIDQKGLRQTTHPKTSGDGTIRIKCNKVLMGQCPGCCDDVLRII
jgi:hypothetical protein